MSGLLRQIVLRLMGAFIASFILLRLLLSVLTKGRRVLEVKNRPMPPKILNDPRWGEHKYLRIPGLLMHYVEKGDRDKPLMIFLHGFPECWFSWRYQLEYFAQHYWCVAPDNRGYGDTEKPTGLDKYKSDLLAEDVKNLVKALGRERCILVGHDWGGAIGYFVCDRYPEIVQAYVAINIPHPVAFGKEIAGTMEQRMKSWYMLYFQCPLVPEFALRFNDIEAFDGVLSDLVNKPDDLAEVTEAYKFVFRDRNSFHGPINYYRASAQLPTKFSKTKLKVPVLSIFGTGDKYITVAAAKNTPNYVEDCTEVYLEGISHFSMMDAPQQVNKEIEQYLKKRDL